jgi:hypothetical protein
MEAPPDSETFTRPDSGNHPALLLRFLQEKPGAFAVTLLLEKEIHQYQGNIMSNSTATQCFNSNIVAHNTKKELQKQNPVIVNYTLYQ